MARILALIGLLPVLAFGGDHWLLSFPPTGVTATSTAVVVTSPASTKGIIKGVMVTAEKAAIAADEVVVTTAVLGTRNGQTRTITSVISTSAVPSVATVTLPVLDEVISLSITSTGTNSHNQTHTVYPLIIYEK
jgi:hypothetical protein